MIKTIMASRTRHCLFTFIALTFACAKVFAEGLPLTESSSLVALDNEAARLEKSERSQLAFIRSAPSVRQANAVLLKREALLETVISISLPNGKSVRIAKNRDELHATSKTWFGRTNDGGEATFVQDESGISGTFFYSGKIYELRTLNGRFHALIEIDNEAFPPEHSMGSPSGALDSPDKKELVPSNFSNSTAAMPGVNDAGISPVININILVAYTKNAILTMGNAGSYAQLAVSNLNQSFLNSGVKLQATLVGEAILMPDEYDTSGLALAAVMNNAKVLSRRDAVSADIVVIAAHFGGDCGEAKQVLATAETAFAAVADICFVSDLSMAHEIGHLLGGRHDLERDPRRTPFEQGHGVHWWRIDKVCWHTIMSYKFPVNQAYQCNEDPRINYWSNPSIKYNSLPLTGTSAADSSMNMASVLNMTGWPASNFHTTKLGKPSSTFGGTGVNAIFQILFNAGQ